MSEPRSKDFLRTQFKNVRAQVPPDLAEAASLAVTGLFFKSREYKEAGRIGGFFSLGTEIDTFPILEGILKDGKELFLPRLVKDHHRFDYIQVQDFNHLSEGTFGIQEPVGGHPVDPARLDLVLVPGLAFDTEGNRLGFGLGFYDRILPRLRKDAFTLGLGYGFQVVERLPLDPHDVPLKAVLTEKGFTYRRQD